MVASHLEHHFPAGKETERRRDRGKKTHRCLSQREGFPLHGAKEKEEAQERKEIKDAVRVFANTSKPSYRAFVDWDG